MLWGGGTHRVQHGHAHEGQPQRGGGQRPAMPLPLQHGGQALQAGSRHVHEESLSAHGLRREPQLLHGLGMARVREHQHMAPQREYVPAGVTAAAGRSASKAA